MTIVWAWPMTRKRPSFSVWIAPHVRLGTFFVSPVST